ncbi:hypothetical protein JQF37_01735 [Pseudomonas sp. MIL9]|uniref:hypothetical protein n=1 Tax=Pseudomonas sp. MIL9 TaxID=2807620 RepID=UPI00194FB291|nr:hypothetical protein [Pseudomonas sp. MIL9]MBM6442349.1 hypothetical protein [Pseudomonas sp. MIL9]
MSERQAFMAAIKRMWLNLGRPEASWDAVHDWDYYFRQGVRADDAHIAFQDAINCE